MSNKKWYNYFVVTNPAETTSDTRPAPPSSPRRVTEIVPDAGGDTTFTSPVTTPTDLAEIYTSAQIATPGHGYTVLKVAEMLQSEHIRSLPPDVKQRSIMVALDAAGVKVAEIIDDAVQRDRALDTYERVLQKHLEELRAAKAAENRQIEDEINQRVAELRAKVNQNDAELDGRTEQPAGLAGAQAPGRRSHRRGRRLLRLGESDHDVHRAVRQGRLQCSIGWAGCSGPGWGSSSRWVKIPR